MKDNRDPGTLDLLSPAKRKPGPKPSGKAKSAAQRMREYRRRNVTVKASVLEAAMVTAGEVGAAGRLLKLEDENGLLKQRIAALEAQLRNATGKRK